MKKEDGKLAITSSRNLKAVSRISTEMCVIATIIYLINASIVDFGMSCREGDKEFEIRWMRNRHQIESLNQKGEKENKKKKIYISVLSSSN